MMFAKYFEYYTIIRRGALFRGHAVIVEIYISLLYGLRDGRAIKQRFTLFNQGLYLTQKIFLKQLLTANFNNLT